jgi:hypothetical protein
MPSDRHPCQEVFQEGQAGCLLIGGGHIESPTLADGAGLSAL